MPSTTNAKSKPSNGNGAKKKFEKSRTNALLKPPVQSQRGRRVQLSPAFAWVSHASFGLPPTILNTVATPPHSEHLCSELMVPAHLDRCRVFSRSPSRVASHQNLPRQIPGVLFHQEFVPKASGLSRSNS